MCIDLSGTRGPITDLFVFTYTCAKKKTVRFLIDLETETNKRDKKPVALTPFLRQLQMVAMKHGCLEGYHTGPSSNE